MNPISRWALTQKVAQAAAAVRLGRARTSGAPFNGRYEPKSATTRAGAR